MDEPTLRPTWRRAVIAPAALAVVYTAAAAVAALVTGNGEFLFYAVVMALLIAALTLAHWRTNFTAPLVWALAVWGLLHMAGGIVPLPARWPIHGDVRVLYSWWIIPRADGGGWLKYDHVVHAYGFGVATWACWQGLQAAAKPKRPTFGLMVLVAAGGLGFGALNEVIEFLATLFGPTNVGGYVNTGIDLIANTVGAVAAAVAIYVGERRRGEG